MINDRLQSPRLTGDLITHQILVTALFTGLTEGAMVLANVVHSGTPVVDNGVQVVTPIFT